MLYLGTHRPTWLRDPSLPPLFVSRRTMPTRRRYPSATRWAMDSGGFTELQQHGRWTITADQYAAECVEVAAVVGNVDWFAPQDWMCEPEVITGGRIGPLTFVGTGLDVDTHQRLTVDNLLTLRNLAPTIPFIPVLQGFTLDDYLDCVDMYTDAGIDLAAEPIVGVGSVCRRQATHEAATIFRHLSEQLGLSVHAFGLKQKGIAASWPWLTSADSLAWSFNARFEARRGIRHGCTRDKSCANHKHYAVDWHHRTMQHVAPIQTELDFRGTT